MAETRLRVDDFEDGVLPAVCVSSGVPADTHYVVRAHSQAWWPLVFLLLGPVGLVVTPVVLIGTHRSVGGSLPFADEVQRVSAASRRGRLAAAAVSAVGGGAMVLVAAGADDRRAALIIGLIVVVMMCGFLVAAERPTGSVGLKLTRDGRRVIVRGAASAFVDEYERQERQRRASRQRPAESL